MLVLTATRPTPSVVALSEAVGSVEITVPPLRTRREDIALLIAAFAESAGGRGVSSQLIRLLTQADWPGNISQLRTLIEHTAVGAIDGTLTIDDLPKTFQRGMIRGRLSRLEEAELQEMRAALKETGGNRRLAADLLQIGRSTLYRRLDSYARRGIVV